MLSKQQEKLIRQLHHKKGREKHGLCLVEGEKNIEAAKKRLSFTFTPQDTALFQELVTTETPQDIAGVAEIPETSLESVLGRERILLLDGVQDPGNVGTILRLCQAFDAGLLLFESGDVSSPKVIRASAGAFFSVPWKKLNSKDVSHILETTDKPIYRLEKKKGAIRYQDLDTTSFVLIVGSEGTGIHLNTKAPSVFIPHDASLESLNVAQATAITLSHAYSLSHRE